jgi:hypothetical protein
MLSLFETFSSFFGQKFIFRLKVAQILATIYFLWLERTMRRDCPKKKKPNKSQKRLIVEPSIIIEPGGGSTLGLFEPFLLRKIYLGCQINFPCLQQSKKDGQKKTLRAKI